MWMELQYFCFRLARLCVVSLTSALLADLGSFPPCLASLGYAWPSLRVAVPGSVLLA
jgi:hypothetical protein